MILDYNYHKQKRQFSISYVTENGGKSILRYNVNRFKSFVEDPNGEYENWNGNKCAIRMVDKPGWTEYKTFLEELPERDKKLIFAKNNPQLYTFDIEVKIEPDVFPEPEQAAFPILTISIVNENLDAVVLGIKDLSDPDRLQRRYEEWLNTVDFYVKLGLPKPKASYVYFNTEGEMLRYFLEQIVAKTPVLAGWNSLGFDWYYIQNRCKIYYPDISFNSCSIDRTMGFKQIQDFKGNKIRLNTPNHTLVLDMMDIIGTFDMFVMPIKESLALDYISTESIGVGKIKYDGDLQRLYEQDYSTYVFYNLIDSVLVQLINKRFRTLQVLYNQSLICHNRISAAFSKIAATESLFFNYWYKNGIKIVPSERFSGERGTLVGAYVRQPTPGKHKLVCCNDFSGLYPAVIISCNFSVENYMGSVSDGTFTEDQLDRYRKDPMYFVSVNGSVYKNDKDYAFKAIQLDLRKSRSKTKYLSKSLDATVMSDMEHIKGGSKPKNQTYTEDQIAAMKDLGFDVKCTNDLYKVDLAEFERKMKLEINFMVVDEQAYKLLGNSGYGGSSHVAFEWFNINLANDITAEARNLIHKMEKHIPEHFQGNWYKMTDLHKTLNIKLKKNFNQNNVTPLISIVYGDTDSLYMSYSGMLDSIDGSEKWTDRQKTEFLVNLNTKYLNGHNKQYMTEYYRSRNARNVDTDMVHEFELETIALSGVWLDVKKRYAQMLLWKDGKFFDEGEYPLKAKGIETTKSSYPAPARKILKNLMHKLLSYDGADIHHVLNKMMQEGKQEWMNIPVESISPAISVNNYNKYIISDDDPTIGIQCEKATPFAVRGLAYYNWLRQTKHLKGDPIYGGKLKYYIVKEFRKKKKADQDMIFTFMPSELPAWAEQYAPVDREALFKKCVLDPMNRILSAIGHKELTSSGYINIDLFEML